MRCVSARAAKLGRGERKVAWMSRQWQHRAVGGVNDGGVEVDYAGRIPGGVLLCGDELRRKLMLRDWVKAA